MVSASKLIKLFGTAMYADGDCAQEVDKMMPAGFQKGLHVSTDSVMSAACPADIAASNHSITLFNDGAEWHLTGDTTPKFHREFQSL